MLDSRHWKTAEAAASMPFQLDGDAVPTSRTASRRTWVSLAEGVVSRVSGERVWIDAEDPVSLRHSIGPDIDLRLLLGRRVRATLLHVAALDAGLTQTLTIAARTSRRWSSRTPAWCAARRTRSGRRRCTSRCRSGREGRWCSGRRACSRSCASAITCACATTMRLRDVLPVARAVGRDVCRRLKSRCGAGRRRRVDDS